MNFKKLGQGRRFNSKQIEGLAKLLEGLAQAFIIELSIGSTTSTRVGVCCRSVCFLAVPWFLWSLLPSCGG
jgi:hypothetical protein